MTTFEQFINDFWFSRQEETLQNCTAQLIETSEQYFSYIWWVYFCEKVKTIVLTYLWLGWIVWLFICITRLALWRNGLSQSIQTYCLSLEWDSICSFKDTFVERTLLQTLQIASLSKGWPLRLYSKWLKLWALSWRDVLNCFPQGAHSNLSSSWPSQSSSPVKEEDKVEM